MGDILVEMLKPIIGGFVGVAFGYWIKGKEMRWNELGARLDDICREIQMVEAIAQHYWGTAKDSTESKSNESKIKGRLKRIGVYIFQCAERDRRFGDGKLNNLLIEFRQATTSGQFEQSDRVADPTRIELILGAATELQVQIRQRRTSWRNLFWV
jgi:hypothetical protein